MRKKKKDTDFVEVNEDNTTKSSFFNKIRGVVPESSDEQDDMDDMDDMDTEDENVTETPVKLNLKPLRNIAIIIVAVIIIRFIVVELIPGANYNSYEVLEDASVTNANMTDYIAYQDSMIKYSRDGVTYIDEKGEAVWTETYAMKMPVADVCGEYIAIADLNGNDVYIFNKEGKVNSCTMPYNICDISVASQGEFAVILEGGKNSYTNMYDRDGNQIMERKTSIDQQGYPLDVDLSVDGKKLFSSYLSINQNGELENKLTASNFGEVGQNENADRIVGAYQLENTIVPKVEFLDNNTVCAFGDNQFIIYSMKEKSSQKTKIEFDSEIQSVVFDSQYIGVVLVNTEEDAQEPYVLKLYNTSGHEVMRKNLDFDYDNVQMRGDEIIFTGGNECRIYTIKGKVKFNCTFSKTVKDVVPTGYSKRYIVLYENGSEVIRLKHARVKE